MSRFVSPLCGAKVHFICGCLEKILGCRSIPQLEMAHNTHTTHLHTHTHTMQHGKLIKKHSALRERWEFRWSVLTEQKKLLSHTGSDHQMQTPYQMIKHKIQCHMIKHKIRLKSGSNTNAVSNAKDQMFDCPFWASKLRITVIFLSWFVSPTPRQNWPKTDIDIQRCTINHWSLYDKEQTWE